MDAKEIAKAAIEGYKGNSQYVNLDDGESIVVAFVGMPFTWHVLWSDKKETYELWDSLTDEQKKGEEPTPKFYQQLWTPKGGVKRMEMTLALMKKAFYVDSKYDEGNGWKNKLFEIKRDGVKKATKWDVVYDRDLTAEEKKEIAGLKLLTPEELGKEKLESIKGNKSNGGGGGKTDLNSAHAVDSTPIDGEKATQLAGRIKILSQEKRNLFLTKFGIQQIRALKASDEISAFQFADYLEGKTAAPAEIDPFALTGLRRP